MSNVTYERVNWEDSPSENTPVNGTNLNKMDKGIADCAAAVNECFQSASNGKALIASAITGKGVETASDATYAVMAGNITNELMKIPTANLDITSNGVKNVLDYKTVNVNIPYAQEIAYSNFLHSKFDQHMILNLTNFSYQCAGNGGSTDVTWNGSYLRLRHWFGVQASDNSNTTITVLSDGWYWDSQSGQKRWLAAGTAITVSGSAGSLTVVRFSN
ncbi:hypothetical protein [Pseudobutyrivibrio sp.]